MTRTFDCGLGTTASGQQARVSSIRCVSRVRLQKGRKSLRLAFARLLRNSSAQPVVWVPRASARTFFRAPSMVSGKGPAHLRYRSQRHADDQGVAELPWQAVGYRFSELQRAECHIERRSFESAIGLRPGFLVTTSM